MKLTILGSGAAIPDGIGVQSGYIVKKPESPPLLIDCGSGILYRIGQSSYSLKDIDSVLISHTHPDHITDLIGLVQARNLQGEDKLKIFGPKETEETVKKLLQAVKLWEKTEIEITHLENNSQKNIDGYIIETLKTKHSKPCFAYKIDNKIAYTADTEKFEKFSDFLKKVNIIIHDASFPQDLEIKNHPGPKDIGEIVKDTEAQLLILSHLYPQGRESIDSTLEYLNEKFRGIIKPASDLDTFVV